MARCPELADDLLSRNALAVCNLLAAFAYRGLETNPILGIELVAVVILLDELKANADLWLLDVASGASRRLTANKASDTSPAFSPDGKRLAFLSKREGDAAAQIYVLPLDGGEPDRQGDMRTVDDP